MLLDKWVKLCGQTSHNVGSWEKVFLGPGASCDVVTEWSGHYESWFQNLVLFLGAWV